MCCLSVSSSQRFFRIPKIISNVCYLKTQGQIKIIIDSYASSQSRDCWNIDNRNLHFVFLQSFVLFKKNKKRMIPIRDVIDQIIIFIISFFEMIIEEWESTSKENILVTGAYYLFFKKNFLMDLSYLGSPCMKLHLFTESLLTVFLVWWFRKKWAVI